jgi:hypothetical protein
MTWKMITLTAGVDRPGPRVINFANILKYDYIPLARTISSCAGRGKGSSRQSG